MLKKIILLSSVLICCTLFINCGKKDVTDKTSKDASETLKQENETVSPKPSPDVSPISSIQNQDVKVNSSTPPTDREVDNITPTNTPEPFVGSMDLDSKTAKFFYGTWKVEKLLVFANSYNDASEYPTGQKIIGDEIIINEDFFSSKGLENYNDYQYEIENPIYDINYIFYDEVSFYREFKTELPDLNTNDEVKDIEVEDSSIARGILLSFLIINNKRLILEMEATFFELERVSD